MQQSTKRALSQLKESPHQQDLFTDLSNDQLDELAADMAANGQRDPIFILPDGVVLDGHQRWRAAEKLGWVSVDVIVREDLANVDAGTVEAFMISCNLHRRQMDPLATARVYKRLKQIELGRGRDGFSAQDRRELRDRLARRLGCKSGRTLDRYVQLLDTPREVQDAVSEGRLPMSDALKVLGLSPQEQQAVVDGIRAGRGPKEVIADFFPKPPALPKPDSKDIEGDLGVLQDVVDRLDDTIIQLLRAELPDDRKVAGMEEATSLLHEVLAEELA